MNEKYHIMLDIISKEAESSIRLKISLPCERELFMWRVQLLLDSGIFSDREQKGRVGYYAISFIHSTPKEMSLNQKVVKRHKKDYLLLK